MEINGQANWPAPPECSLEGANVFTMEGFPEYVKDTIAKSFVNGGQCSVAFVFRVSLETKVLLENNPSPTIDEVRQAIKPHICRCTGYKKLKVHSFICRSPQGKNFGTTTDQRKVGVDHLKYDAYGTAIGERKFTDDILWKACSMEH